MDDRGAAKAALAVPLSPHILAAPRDEPCPCTPEWAVPITAVIEQPEEGKGNFELPEVEPPEVNAQ